MLLGMYIIIMAIINPRRSTNTPSRTYTRSPSVFITISVCGTDGYRAPYARYRHIIPYTSTPTAIKYNKAAIIMI